MADLLNSTRISFKATYVPSTIQPQERQQTGRALEKLAYLHSLDVTPEELQRLRETGQAAPGLLDLVDQATGEGSVTGIRRYGPAVAAVPVDDLAAAGRAVAEIRSATSPASAAQAVALAESLAYKGVLEPVGWLHLERMEMTPVGVEHGELVHSVPLTPKETVNITHREWTVTTQTFETLVQDSLEGFSETGVTDKTDLAQTTDTEAKHSSALDVSGGMSATYNGGSYSVTASAAVDYKQQSDVSESVKASVAHSVAITKHASSRTRKEHKQSFRVSSVAGAEDLAVRVITNPSDTHAMRVDYFQLLRRWKVDLIRYGLRMTYDLVVPNPGFDLIQKVLEVASLEQQIAAGHTFDVPLTAITPGTWAGYAHDFDAEVDPPPVDPVELVQTVSLQKSIDVFTFSTMGFDLPDGYAATSGHFHAQVHIGDGDFGSGHRAQIGLMLEGSSGQFPNKDGSWDVDLTANTVVGHTGQLSLVYDYYNVESGAVIVAVTASPTPAAMAAWQVRAWNQLRQADEANYQASLQRMKDRQAQLTAEIGEFDSLTLRKMEHEEIMRAVLTWLLGPKFTLMPGEIAALFEGHPDPAAATPLEMVYKPADQLTSVQWAEVIQGRGELIKFLHNAIEWENVLFFVYPYFWDHAYNWPFKQFLVHPDPVHREFLRSGCARVVLTIRPGFETAFATLLDTGDATQPPDQSSPYVTLAEETRNYAMTNYENIPPANPDHNVRELLYPQQRAAWNDIQYLMLLLEDSRTAHGRYPTTGEGLGVLQPRPQGPPVPSADPWGRAYQYSSPGVHNDYDLASYGADGKPGGTGLDSDITSWAEGSVVGRWYEYTPTNALDVSINTILPTKPEPA
jgi:Type II secretion system (T2SS), protein G